MNSISVCNDLGQSPPLGAWGVYDRSMEKLTPLTDAEMASLLASSDLVFTAAPEGTVSPASEVRVTVHATPCFLG